VGMWTGGGGGAKQCSRSTSSRQTALYAAVGISISIIYLYYISSYREIASGRRGG